MKIFLLTISIFLFALISKAQIIFQKTFGGTANYYIGNSIQQTADGGYISTGYTSSFGVGMGDAYLIKTDANGDSLWTRTFGGVNDDIGRSVEQTADSGYIITGNTGSFGAGNSDVYLIKTDANGDTLWTKTFGGALIDGGNYVRQTTDGGYIISGVTTSFGAGNNDVYLVKTDSVGNLSWSKTFGNANTDDAQSVQQTTDGGYIIAGNFVFPVNIHLIKTDANGNMLWRKSYGGSGNDYAMSAKQTTDGGYIITGWTTTFGAGLEDVYLIKTDSIGDTLWTKTFGGTNQERGYDVEQTKDSGYIVTGYTYSFGAGNFDVYLIKTDVNGNLVWTKTFGGAGGLESGYSVHQTTDKGYIVAGLTNGLPVGNNISYMIKTDSLGNSGCNQGSTATIVASFPAQITSPPTIVTTPATVVTAPYTMVGSGNTITTLCSGTVSVNEITNGNSFLISPNPSNEKFIISFERTVIKGMVEILNVLGKNIFAENIFNESEKEISLKNTLSGIYFVKVFDGERSYCKKLIVE